MSYDYSENILVQESAGNLLRDELGWDVQFAYNTEVLGRDGTFGRESYKEILLLQAQLLACVVVVVGVKHLHDGLCQVLLLHRLLVIAPVKGV